MKLIKSKIQVLLFSLLIFIPILTVAQSNDDCLMCHSDQEMTTERNGKEVSLFVDETILAKSPHVKLNCVSCHLEFNPDDLPHKENITPINCLLCHKDAPVKHSFLPQMLKAKGTDFSGDTSCKNCHGTHNVVSPKVKGSKWSASNLTQSCGNCHKDINEIYQTSQHSLDFSNNIKGAPNCLTCRKSNIGKISSEKNLAESPLSFRFRNQIQGCIQVVFRSVR